MFDGSVVRMNQQTELVLVETAQSLEDSAFTLQLIKGTIWTRTPTLHAFSGSILRTVTTPSLQLSLPSNAEVLIAEQAIAVLEADGLGLDVRTTQEDAESYTIGEGQHLMLPEQNVSADLYAHRSSLQLKDTEAMFINESRRRVNTEEFKPVAIAGLDDVETLTVSEPANGDRVASGTVKVRGGITSNVQRVRVNGYQATIDRENGTFSQELAISKTGEIDIHIEALAENGIVLAETTRTIVREATKLDPPTIVSPAKGGDTYRTQREELEITGKVGSNVAGIMVNDYRLQLFNTGDVTWSYLASRTLGNLQPGTNTFAVTTINEAGERSEPATLVILWEPGEEGVVQSGQTSSTTAPVTEESLPNNEPLRPGSLAVTAPTPGESHTTTDSEFLLEGTTVPETASIWVNGYRLQLYTSGKTTWNYIAKVEYQTLRPGRNVYRIVARDVDGKIIDRFQYTVTYKP
jgi:hypothetical protein